eukprot:CAMPEP_0194511432 /NCGR_PEP_ID=MMETSP0253-20130528/43115_1 /TAXON_ID=2966 /ORGANISM="Noctiluca scintillans" /LENGTH=121 /DNA_ID=CAMNT_0039354765 /DNA_START=258 /DNA_END=623 /DNA_ORIENTATION=-
MSKVKTKTPGRNALDEKGPHDARFRGDEVCPRTGDGDRVTRGAVNGNNGAKVSGPAGPRVRDNMAAGTTVGDVFVATGTNDTERDTCDVAGTVGVIIGSGLGTTDVVPGSIATGTGRRGAG